MSALPPKPTRVSRELKGCERDRCIAEHLAWLERRNQSDASGESAAVGAGSPLAVWLALNAMWGMPAPRLQPVARGRTDVERP